LHSFVAKAVHPEQYHEKPPLLAGYYTYWSGLPMDGHFDTYVRRARGWAAWPTNDDLTLLVVGWPFAEFEANKTDIEGNYLKSLEQAPEFAERVRAAKREERFVGTAVPNYFRKPFGPGWVLVGDAGYNKDPITAQGISDAFHDAEACTAALDDVFRGERSFDAAMADFHPVGFRAMAVASAEDVSDVLSSIVVPTLLVYGDHEFGRCRKDFARTSNRKAATGE
jgi:2-polyprenyl-6-methoxyphenol hydroxylase-like FAD-dependent oxidoreductase